MTLEELTLKAHRVVEPGSDFTKRVSFDLGEQGRLFIDGGSGQVDNSDYYADITIRITLDNLDALLHGRLEPQAANADGTFEVTGGDPTLVRVLDALSEQFDA